MRHVEPSELQRQEWMRRFADCLLALRPSTGREAAHEVAHAAFMVASDMVPDDAAEVFCDVLNANVPVHDLRRWMNKAKGSP